MEKETEQDFTFGNDGPEDDFDTDLTTARIAKLNQKVAFITILLPVVVVVLAVFIYFDISSKVVKVDSSGDARVQTISQTIEKSVADLKTNSAALETRLNKKIGSIESSIAGLKKKMKKAEKNINFMTWSKSDKKPTNKKIDEAKADTASIRAELKKLTSQTSELAALTEAINRRTKEIDVLNATVKRLQTELKNKNDNYISRAELDNLLKKQKRLYKLEIEQFSEKFNKKLALVKYAAETNTPKPPVIEKDVKQ